MLVVSVRKEEAPMAKRKKRKKSKLRCPHLNTMIVDGCVTRSGEQNGIFMVTDGRLRGRTSNVKAKTYISIPVGRTAIAQAKICVPCSVSKLCVIDVKLLSLLSPKSPRSKPSTKQGKQEKEPPKLPEARSDVPMSDALRRHLDRDPDWYNFESDPSR